MTNLPHFPITSPYRRGADDGARFGVYLTVLFFASVFSSRWPALSMLVITMMALVPFVIYYYINRYDKSLNNLATFPMMWMHGVMIFICGVLISGALLLIYLKWFDPDYVKSQMEGLVEMGAHASPDSFLAESATLAQRMLAANFIPRPIAVVTELIMGAIVTGSFLSIAISAGIAFSHKLRRRREEDPDVD